MLPVSKALPINLPKLLKLLSLRGWLVKTGTALALFSSQNQVSDHCNGLFAEALGEELLMVWKRCLQTLMICCLLGNSPALAGEVAECGSGGLQIDPEQIVSRLTSPNDPLQAAPVRSDGFAPQGPDRNPEPLATVAADAMVAFSPAPAIGVFAGYRFPEKDVAKSSVRTDTEFDGPYVGALIRF